ncbi:Protein-glutamate methylesterase [Flavobacterium sp. 9AF]|uniref:chemotaxis protein CheB n=1 Tax=Flavobacterium sp. 9AF TaxID=2653142 RepID=UPI0012F3C653|nr:chemotaxis protein CheB [Flavobacterium sp. 9AF]VXB51371.1 Protein-glutamate methylesterase [Flavobacterium sp. 9AF]
MINKDSSFYVVGIGASAGGLDAIQHLFDNIPQDTGMSFVIIQHLSPDFVSLMPELLAKHTKMKIFTAQEELKIEPNCIYLNQRNKNLFIKDGKLHLINKGPKENLNFPIDIFFHSLGEEYKEKSIGIILSGTGSDGSRGIKTIKEAGGIVLVQEPGSAQFDGMPNSAIATNQFDFILETKEIGNTLKTLEMNRLSFIQDDYNPKLNEELIQYILTDIFNYSGIDFREYKRNTLLRRIEKRMGINSIYKLFDYYNFLKNNEAEKIALQQDFLIGVTRFFRDEEAFHILEDKVIPTICKNKKSFETIRIWVAGCSTGEEAYSIAILLDNYIRSKKINIDFKIFATDVDEVAVSIASAGLFHVNTANEIKKNFLEQYFIKTGNKIQIIKRIREKIVFSKHNLFLNPPFIKMDLISCRNLLIYLDNKVQKKIMDRFQFSLNKFGFLFLGSSESLGDNAKYYDTVDTKWKIYQNISDEKSIPKNDKLENKLDDLKFKASEHIRTGLDLKFKTSPEIVFHKYLAKKFSPDSIFIDNEYNVLFISGNAGKKIIQSEGVFQNNLLKIVSPKIAVAIKNGVQKLETENKPVVLKDLINKTEHTTFVFDITIHKSNDYKELINTYILQFSEDKEVKEEVMIIKDIPIDEISRQRQEELENELIVTKAELQKVVEELETSNEELQSSNEELMASNEELQTTNEELQSVNEELYTVNAELQEKNRELQNLNNDVNNLLNNTDIGTLFLDANLRIRKFTPTLQKLFNLQEIDYGRPISSFSSNFNEAAWKQMLEDSKIALEKLVTFEKEVIDNKENHYLIRIIPFITNKKVIDGVVITFVDINQLRRKEAELSKSETHLKKAQEIAKVGSWYLDIATNEVTWTEELYKMYGFDSEKPVPPYSEHKKLFTKESWEILSSSLDKTAKEGIPYELELQTVRKDKSKGWMWVRGEALKDENGTIYALWGAAQDISIRKEESIKLRHFKKAFDSTKEAISISTKEGSHFYHNKAFTKLFGYENDELPHNSVKTLYSSSSLSEEVYGKIMEGKSWNGELEMMNKNNRKFSVSLRADAIFDAKNRIIGLIQIYSDINDKIEADKVKQLQHAKTLTLFDAINQIVYVVDPKTDELIFTNKIFNEVWKNNTPILGKKSEEIIQGKKTEKQIISDSEKSNSCIWDYKSKFNNKWYRCNERDIDWIDGRKLKMVTALDITDIKSVQSELIKAKDKAEESDRLKSAFLANMSHEIRTPMNGIVGFTNLLLEPNLTGEEQQQYIEIIQKSGYRMLNTLNDLIDISKVETGQMEVYIKEFNICEEIENNYEFFKSEARQKGLNLILKKPIIKKDLIIYSDQRKINSILTNLIKNAIKYTDTGTIEISYSLENQQLFCQIKDTGIGIPKNRQEAIFDRFVQADISDIRAFEGSGLGLTIAKAYVEILGGTIGLESEEGIGSIFYFSIPIQDNESKKEEKIKNAIEQKTDFSPINKVPKILVSEDDETCFQHLDILLKDVVAEIIHARNGLEAVEICKKNPDINLILMDIKMPKLNGYEATKEIRTFNKDVTIIAQTAYALAGDHEKAIKAGCNDYIPKPIKKEKLYSLIKKWTD